MNESRFDRGAWLTLAFVVCFSVIAIAATLYTLAQPSDGWLRDINTAPDKQPLTFYFGSGQTPLQVGDRITRIGALDMPDNLEVFHTDLPAAWQTGATIPYTGVRDEQTLLIPVTLQQADTAGILRALWNTMQQSVFEWSWAVIALIVFILNPRTPAARLLLIMGISENVVTKISWGGQTTAFYFTPPLIYYARSMADFFWAYIFIPSIILLAQSFPLRTFPFSRYPRVVTALLYGVPFVIAISYFGNHDLNLVNVLLAAQGLLIVAAFVGAIVNAWRNSRDAVVRAQVLWLAFGFILSFGIALPTFLLETTGVLDANSLNNGVGQLVGALSTLALPVCLAIGITRYRLFDISVIIRRTVTYAIVAALLAVVYFGSVIVLQQIFSAIFGQQSEVITVISTLVIAVLFIPLRNRVQSTMDRRFNRKKYDAQRVLNEFATTVRDETDLEKLTGSLVGVVNETVQPRSVSLWLKKSNDKATG